MFGKPLPRDTYVCLKNGGQGHIVCHGRTGLRLYYFVRLDSQDKLSNLPYIRVKASDVRSYDTAMNDLQYQALMLTMKG